MYGLQRTQAVARIRYQRKVESIAGASNNPDSKGPKTEVPVVHDVAEFSPEGKRFSELLQWYFTHQKKRPRFTPEEEEKEEQNTYYDPLLNQHIDIFA